MCVPLLQVTVDRLKSVKALNYSVWNQCIKVPENGHCLYPRFARVSRNTAI